MELDKIQKRLRSVIAESGYTQKDIAAGIGVSPQTVSHYMRDDVFPALDTLSKLCIFLNVSADYILGVKD